VDETAAVRAAVVLGLALVVTGCGSSSPQRWARPQSVRLGWHENCGTRARPLPVETRRLTVGERRWRVELSFRNETGITLGVVRPHAPGETLFGLAPYRTTSLREVLRRAETSTAKPQTYADRFEPRQPRLLSPGERWSGSFSGLGRLPHGVPIRVVLGRFVITGEVPSGLVRMFLCVSRRYVRLR
jgi:hypothetical protein